MSYVLKSQFKVNSVEQLGCGTVEKIIANAKSQQTSSSSIVSYLLPVVFTSEDVSLPYAVLTQVTFEDALKCLQSAPLLSNLSVWSNWELVYQPTCGPLYEFLTTQQNYVQPNERIFVLEVSPFVLLKISPDSTLQDFTTAVDELNASNAAGHLVSVAVKAKHISCVSIDLYAQHVHTKLLKVIASNGDHLVCEFVFHCLVLMPLALSCTIGKEVCGNN